MSKDNICETCGESHNDGDFDLRVRGKAEAVLKLVTGVNESDRDGVGLFELGEALETLALVAGSLIGGVGYQDGSTTDLVVSFSKKVAQHARMIQERGAHTAFSRVPSRSELQ